MATKEQQRVHIKKDCVERPAWDHSCLFCGEDFPSKHSLAIHSCRWCKERPKHYHFIVNHCKLLPFCCSKYISEHILIFIIECRSLSKTLQQCETAKVLKTSQYCENALKSRVDDGVGYSVGHWVINGVVGHGRCRGFGHGVGYGDGHGVSYEVDHGLGVS